MLTSAETTATNGEKAQGETTIRWRDVEPSELDELAAEQSRNESLALLQQKPHDVKLEKKTIMDENLKNLNSNVAAYEKISRIQLYPTEFEKTPKRSIKRYLYNSIAVD